MVGVATGVAGVTGVGTGENVNPLLVGVGVVAGVGLTTGLLAAGETAGAGAGAGAGARAHCGRHVPLRMAW